MGIQSRNPETQQWELQYQEDRCGSTDYVSAAYNTLNFQGWERYIKVVDAVLAQAKASGLDVEVLDYYNEMNLDLLPVQGRLIYDNTPGRQYDDACRIAGPDNPRWVNSAASRNAALPALATTSAETPDSSRNSASSPPSVSGTSAGRGSTTLSPKRRARS